MPTRISVTVKGPVGLDEPDEMLADLVRETNLSWQLHEVKNRKVLASTTEIILIAVVTTATDISVRTAVDGVKRAVKRWRAKRLDPLETTVDTKDLPEDGSDH